ncbi:hypothetical protein GCM10009839_58260 [Catenulispora yoronensis]|uniref:Uncharacterized protein n=1 Tax=Catenulispora yoronensis TaxID=450799 RepID=A0ABP5GGW7_9ACTN
MWLLDDMDPTTDEAAQLLRWGRAQRISLCSDDLLSFDDEDLYTYSTRRTRPRYKSERRRGYRESDER